MALAENVGRDCNWRVDLDTGTATDMIQQNYRIGIDGIDIDIKIDMHVAAASPSQHFGVSRALSLSWSVVFVWALDREC